MKLKKNEKLLIKDFLKNYKLSNTVAEELILKLESNRDKKSNRFLDKIITSLSNETLFFEKKSAFNNLYLLNEEGLKSIASDIIKKISYRINQAQKKDDFVVHTDFEKDDIKGVFKITWSNEKQKEIIGVPENNLERLISFANKNSNKKFINQFPLPDCGHIDIVYFDKDELNLVELKKWDSGDNPLYAIAELIKNYYLMFLDKNNTVIDHFELPRKYKKVNLMVLAPKEYYTAYNSEPALKGFFVIFNEIKSILLKDNINISMNYVDITREACEKNVRKKYASSFNEKMLPIENLCWEDFIDDFIKEKLMLKTWQAQQINNMELWRKL